MGGPPIPVRVFGQNDFPLFLILCHGYASQLCFEFYIVKQWQIDSLRSMQIHSYGRCQSRACCDLVYWLPDQIIQASINLPPHQRYSQTGKTTSISDHIKSRRSISQFSKLGMKFACSRREGSRYQIGWNFGKIPNGLCPPPPHFWKIMLQIFYNGYGCILEAKTFDRIIAD